ncbi:MAG: orc1/cdc6 family replication initiation protein [Euryarchaeota archaeon]|nr:orc1/cdc6 family replication initiation protein [Euryarchaeota archaeon]MDE1835969.1 orc1/cdc6 family replication initiation protein [Euryarchaeota archaeon]MDE1882074.1 orc1/cdc6 family replication initiation protein [Euryarchaeota archaeon]MDE2044353.1 orc1/cdc6 family replication initiation protein [Thermoplasmata archaeon]
MSATPTISHAQTENDHNLGVSQEATPGLWRDLQVLERSWTPPALIGRDEVLSEVETRVLRGLAHEGRVAVSIFGPKGSGTSAMAAHLVATAKDRLTRPGAKGAPLVIHVDASTHRTPSALVAGPAPRVIPSGTGLARDAGGSGCGRSPASLATALFRELDPSYDGRGASAEFGLLLFLRRLRTMGRPAILLLDQVGAKADLARVVRPLARPERLMPEGAAGLPPLLVVAAGERDAFPEDVEAVRSRLSPLNHHDLCQATQVRANLAFRQEPDPTAIHAFADLSVARGWGLSAVGDLLLEAGRRAESRGSSRVEAQDVGVPAGLRVAAREGGPLDPLVLESLRASPGPLSVGVLGRLLRVRCHAEGVSAPSPARLWRHLVGLERKGIVRREVRVGGAGGSSTQVSLTPEGRSEDRTLMANHSFA